MDELKQRIEKVDIRNDLATVSEPFDQAVGQRLTFSNLFPNSFVRIPTGTTEISFHPTTNTDTMVKHGHSHYVQTRFQCITCMQVYETKSLEELRYEDYKDGNKPGHNGGQPNFKEPFNPFKIF